MAKWVTWIVLTLWCTTSTAADPTGAPPPAFPSANETARTPANTSLPAAPNPAGTRPPAPDKRAIQFRPALLGAPSTRIGGGTRNGIAFLQPQSSPTSARPAATTRTDTFKPSTNMGAPKTRIGGGTRQGFRPAAQFGAPKTRIGGGTREEQRVDDFNLSVLAPEQTGLTVSEAPVLYWYLSHTVTAPIEFTVIEATSIQAGVQPVLELRLEPPVEEGFHAIDLAQHDIHLQTGTEYQWSIAIIQDESQRSADTLAAARVKRVDTSVELQRELAKNPIEASRAYAAAGIWYEALNSLMGSTRNALSPADRAQEATLLRQVGLVDAADAMTSEGLAREPDSNREASRY